MGAEPHEHSDGRRIWRNGHYERSLITQVATLQLRVLWAPEATFRTELFQRYQRSEKALIEMVGKRFSSRKVRLQTGARTSSPLLVIEVCAEGYRKILRIQIRNLETEQRSLKIFRWLEARRLGRPWT